MLNTNKLRQGLADLMSAVEGRTVFILGGGSSVTQSILDKLNKKNHKIFCLNSSMKFIDSPLAVLWCDDSWASRNLDILTNSKSLKFQVSRNAQTHIQKHIYGIGESTVLQKTGDFGMDPIIDHVRGNNSGANAINLLINCKVARIGLVGFDMHTSASNSSHFHTDYTYAIRPSVYKDLFIPSINSIKTAMDSAGTLTKIYNCNRYSSLKCFDYMSLDELT